MSLLRPVLGSARGRIVLAALALYLGFQAWLTLAAPAKVAPNRPMKPGLSWLVT